MDIELFSHIPIGWLIVGIVVIYLVGGVIWGRIVYPDTQKYPSEEVPPVIVVFILWPLWMAGIIIYILLIKPINFLITVGQENARGRQGD